MCRQAAALATIDRYAWQTLKSAASMPDDMLPDLSPVFVTASGKEVAALPGGASAVTPASRVEFVASCIRLRSHEFDQQVAAVQKGIAEVLPAPLLSLLTGKEFQDLVCGDADFDVARLKAAARIDGYRSSADQLTWLWKTLGGFTPEQKCMFLRFVGGFTRLPRDLAMLPHRFEVHRVRDNASQLPSAATCFFTLKLPEYTSEEELRTKLLLAIVNCGAIDTDGRGGDFEQMQDELNGNDDEASF